MLFKTPISSLITLALISTAFACSGRGSCPSGLQCRENTACETPKYVLPTSSDYAHISDIQGRGAASPYDGKPAKTMGVVTAVAFGTSYYVQDIYPDADEVTSEALYSFRPRVLVAGNGTLVKPTVGDIVELGGNITEYVRPGRDNDLPLTEYAFGTIKVLQSGAGVSVTPVAFAPPQKVSAQGAYNQNPSDAIRVDYVASNYVCSSILESAICYSEAHESMLVVVERGVTTDPERRFNEVGVVSCGSSKRPELRRCARAPVVAPKNWHGRVVAVEDDLFSKGDRQLTVGTPLKDFRAVISYSFGLYKAFNIEALEASGLPVLRNRGPKACTNGDTNSSKGEIRVASWNVLNLDPVDPPAVAARAAMDIATYQQCPDILALQEIGDDDGTSGGTSSNITTADGILSTIATLLAKASYCDTSYDFVDVDPVDDADGGAPGENIRVAFLFRTDKVALVSGAPAGDAVSSVAWDSTRNSLTLNPGRVSVGAFEDSRKPIAAHFRLVGCSKTVVVVNNHWNSKFGDDAVFGRRQPPLQGSQAERLKQSQAVAAFVQSIPSSQPVMVVGDLNDLHFSKPVNGLGLSNLWFGLKQHQRFSYNFQHRYQTLDHIVVRSSVVKCDKLCAVHTSTLQSYFSDDNISDHDALVAVCSM